MLIWADNGGPNPIDEAMPFIRAGATQQAALPGGCLRPHSDRHHGKGVAGNLPNVVGCNVVMPFWRIGLERSNAIGIHSWSEYHVSIF